MATVKLYKSIIIKLKRYFDINPIGESEVFNLPKVKKEFAKLYPGWQILAVANTDELNDKSLKKYLTINPIDETYELWDDLNQAEFRLKEKPEFKLKVLYHNPWIGAKVTRNTKGQIKDPSKKRKFRKTFTAPQHVIDLIEHYTPTNPKERLSTSLIDLLLIGMDNLDLIDPMLEPCPRLYDIKLTEAENDRFKEIESKFPRAKTKGYNLVGKLIYAGLKAQGVTTDGPRFRYDTGSPIK